MSEIVISGKQENSVKPEAELLVNNNAAAAAGDANAAEAASIESPKGDNNKTPVKRTPSKRMSFIERAQKESEELVKNMGGSLELEGGRRTRSSARGTPTRASVVSTPPPAKKSRTSPTAANTSSPRARGRGRKIDIAETADEQQIEQPETSNEKKLTSKVHNDVKKISVENAENSVVDSANTAAAVKNVTALLAASKDNKESAKEGVESKEKKEQVQSAEKSVKKPVKKEAEKKKDQPDAALPSIPKVQQNNVDHAEPDKAEKALTTTKIDQKELPNTETAMETDEEPVETAVEATPTAAAIGEQGKKTVTGMADPQTTKPIDAAVEKQPTPEPMDVDSSSKSNDDVNETTKNDPAEVTAAAAVVPVVEKLDENIAEANVTTNANALSRADSEPQHNDVKSLTTPQEANEAPAEQKTEAQEKNKALMDIENNKNDETPAKNDGKSTTVANATAAIETIPIVDDKEADELAAVSGDTTKETPAAAPPTAENIKSDNDFCEPKIASPPISAASDAVSAVSTPQYCN